MGGYAKEKAKEGYRKELLEEAEAYLPRKKPTVNIYSGITDVIKENPKLANEPFVKFVERMQKAGGSAAKEGAAMLAAEGVRPEKLRKLTVDIGKEETAAAAYDKRAIKINIEEGTGRSGLGFTMAHELVHGILDRSAFGQYQKALPMKKQKASGETNREIKKGERADEEKIKKLSSISKMASGEMERTYAINEALAYAVADSMEGKRRDKSQLIYLNAQYLTPISKFYPDMMRLIRKAGVKKTIEAVRMLNPEKAEKDPKGGYYKDFTQVKEKLLAKP